MLNVVEIIGKTIGVTTEDGDKLHEKICESYTEGERLEVSFEGMSVIISHFLNVAVGKLYFEFPETSWVNLDTNIVYLGLSDDDNALLKEEVIETAKFQAKNPKKAEEIRKEIFSKGL